jgi:ligand-binding SRPBCC domain-containing protein
VQTMMQAPTNTKTFEHSSVMDTTVEKLVDFHAAPEAFSKLNMPGTFAQIHRRDLPTMTEGEVEFTLWLGPIPVRWHARHEPSVNEHSFADNQLSGPMDYWRHEHIIEPEGANVRLTDRITLSHKDGFAGFLTRLLFDGLPLKILFMYRHWVTRRDVES